MADLQSVRDESRTRLHNTLAIPCRRYRAGVDDHLDVTCRINRKVETSGSLTGGGITYAERYEDVPTLIFLVAENVPIKGDVYSVQEELAFQVDTVEPRHGVTISAVCDRLPVTTARTYDPPGTES